ncbi:MAG: nucleotidyltransferase domain-containing protein [Armatimonadota bacterium]|nr:nucleotidyltransferase domain-containing protein [Armatimonadota bacterium]
MSLCELAALMSEAKCRALALLLLHPQRKYYQREIAQLTGLHLRALQRALEQLVDAGILVREERGNQVFYGANPECPIFEELTRIVVKTAGVADKLREGLAPVSDGIEFAVLFGSFASGNFRPGSDVDVLVVGDIRPREVIGALSAVGLELGREVNPVVMSLAEFEDRVSQGEDFLRNVLEGPHVPLMGDVHETRGSRG